MSHPFRCLSLEPHRLSSIAFSIFNTTSKKEIYMFSKACHTRIEDVPALRRRAKRAPLPPSSACRKFHVETVALYRHWTRICADSVFAGIGGRDRQGQDCGLHADHTVRRNRGFHDSVVNILRLHGLHGRGNYLGRKPHTTTLCFSDNIEIFSQLYTRFRIGAGIPGKLAYSLLRSLARAQTTKCCCF